MGAGPWHYFDHFDAEAIKAFAANEQTQGIFALIAEADRAEVPALQQLCRSHDVTLVGGIFPQLLAGEGLVQQGMLLLPLDQAPQYLLAGNIDSAAATQAVTEKLATKAKDVSGGTLFLLFDAMMPDIASFLHACYLKLADRVTYLGGNAGSESFQPMPCLFDSDRIEEGGLLALLMPQCHGGWLEHGYRLPEELITATAAEGNRIITIDWRPAFEVYQELALRHYGVQITRDNFYEMAVHFPFGIVRANREVIVRIPVNLNDDGSLHCVGEIPPNSLLTLLEGPEESLTDGIRRLSDRIGGRQQGVTFYCAGRRLHLGPERVQAELDLLHQHTGDIYGALTLGEIGSTSGSGYPVLHNACVLFSPCQIRSDDES